MENCLITLPGGWRGDWVMMSGWLLSGPHLLMFWEDRKMFCQDSNKLLFQLFLDFFLEPPRVCYSNCLHVPRPLGFMPGSQGEEPAVQIYSALFSEISVGARGKNKLTLGNFDIIRGWYSIKPTSRVGERRWWILEATGGNVFILKWVSGDFVNRFGVLLALLNSPTSIVMTEIRRIIIMFYCYFVAQTDVVQELPILFFF